MSEAWRVGKNYIIHVYAGNRPVATFHTPEDAARAVAAVNATSADRPGDAAVPPSYGEFADLIDAVAPTPPAPVATTGLRIVLKPLDGPGTEFIEIEDADGRSVRLPSIKRPDGLFEIHVGPPARGGLAALLREVVDKGLIYWEPQTTRGAIAKADMLRRCELALSGQTSGAVPAGDLEDVKSYVENAIKYAERRGPDRVEWWRGHLDAMREVSAKIASVERRARLAEQPGGGPVAPGDKLAKS